MQRFYYVLGTLLSLGAFFSIAGFFDWGLAILLLVWNWGTSSLILGSLEEFIIKRQKELENEKDEQTPGEGPSA